MIADLEGESEMERKMSVPNPFLFRFQFPI